MKAALLDGYYYFNFTRSTYTEKNPCAHYIPETDAYLQQVYNLYNKYNKEGLLEFLFPDLYAYHVSRMDDEHRACLGLPDPKNQTETSTIKMEL